MYTLVLSVGCSVAVSVLLKVARARQIDVAQAIAINYVVAIGFCLALLKPQAASLFNPSTPLWVLLALGLLLPTIFIAMAKAVYHAGIVLSDAAQRLSLLIPLAASFLLFGEVISLSKGAGMALALAALILLLIRPDPGKSGTAGYKPVIYLLCVWVGYGVIDILFKQMAKSGAAFANSLLGAFVLAGLVIFTWLIVKKTLWNRQSIMAGLLLGVLNFGNIYFYIKAHQAFPENPTLVFSAMNIGVISAGALIGAGVFKERLNVFNMVGIASAIGAIVLLFPA